MAQVKALALGGLGSPCCCSAPTGCKLTVHTYWCTDGCVAPGTITVTVREGSPTGTVVCSGTADVNGNYVCYLTATGNYYASASTTTSGYLNDVGHVNITNVSGENCTPANVLSPIYPDQLTLTTVFGTCTISPTATDLTNPCVTSGSSSNYIGSLTYDFPGACTCAAGDVTIWFNIVFCGAAGQTNPYITYGYLYCLLSDLATYCPGNITGDCSSSGSTCQGGVNAYPMTGVGPYQTTCYPVDLTGDPSCFVLCGNCPPNATGTLFTVTQ